LGVQLGVFRAKRRVKAVRYSDKSFSSYLVLRPPAFVSPMEPETTCIGPVASSRQIRRMCKLFARTVATAHHQVSGHLLWRDVYGGLVGGGQSEKQLLTVPASRWRFLDWMARQLSVVHRPRWIDPSRARDTKDSFWFSFEVRLD
jgi:hypothetical protein